MAHQKRDIANIERGLGDLEARCDEVRAVLDPCLLPHVGALTCVHRGEHVQAITSCDSKRRAHTRTLKRIEQVWLQHAPELQVRCFATPRGVRRPTITVPTVPGVPRYCKNGVPPGLNELGSVQQSEQSVHTW